MTMRHLRAFSLVEVTIAMGVVAISVLTLFALIPIGLKSNQNSISQTAAVDILTAVLADMRATPRASATSTQFGVTFGAPIILYFDSEGAPSASPTATSRYRVSITFPPRAAGSRSATLSHIRVSWPARATAANSLGQCEMFAAFDRG